LAGRDRSHPVEERGIGVERLRDPPTEWSPHSKAMPVILTTDEERITGCGTVQYLVNKIPGALKAPAQINHQTFVVTKTSERGMPEAAMHSPTSSSLW
jgi:hypothetical protein